MNYPPPYQDAETLAQHLCVSVRTIWSLVKRGELPAPVYLGAIPRWKWKEVEKRLAHSPETDAPSERIISIREATRAAASEKH